MNNMKKYYTVYKLGNFKATYPNLSLSQEYINYHVRHGDKKTDYKIVIEYFFV